MSKNKFITQLNQVGQSIWYDNLSRDVLESGELANLIAQGVSGLTSNPTIFQKAISASDKYDTEIKKLLPKNLDHESVCEELMIQDVAKAADLLLPVYESTKALDGYASLEVSPKLANDTEGTIRSAENLWKKLARPNIMIKIPATNAGIPAIEKVLSLGINVNVTLIFSEQVYRTVAEAFIKAVEYRVSKNLDISRIASVASFFVSRVDSICEKELDKLKQTGSLTDQEHGTFFGKLGIANSKLAYKAYQELFIKSDRFNKLIQKGAQVQRPLWASTGTKNPVFSPVLYIEALAGKDTVNTVPPATLKALMENCTVASNLEKNLDQAEQLLVSLKSKKVNFDQLLLDLQAQGVSLFADSYNELLSAIKSKMSQLA